MPNLSGLKAEISSVEDIGKITDAMQLVASAKLRKIGKRIAQTQNYVSAVYSFFNDVIQQTDNSTYLKPANYQFKRTLWVVVNSNLGLCGGYNININKLVVSQFKPDDGIYAIGSKAVAYYNARKMKVVKENINVDIDFTSSDASEMGKDMMDFFSNGAYDEVRLAYTKFINNVTFEPTTLRLFPIVKDETGLKTTMRMAFEPDAQTVLSKSLSIYLNTVIYGTIIESQVSEQASRRTAMEAATKNGNELSEKLKIKYNRERQALITQEISEIVGGANALKDS